MKLDNDNLIKVVGGSISGTLLNSITNLIDTIMDVGRSFGTAIKMMFSGRSC